MEKFEVESRWLTWFQSWSNIVVIKELNVSPFVLNKRLIFWYLQLYLMLRYNDVISSNRGSVQLLWARINYGSLERNSIKHTDPSSLAPSAKTIIFSTRIREKIYITRIFRSICKQAHSCWPKLDFGIFWGGSIHERRFITRAILGGTCEAVAYHQSWRRNWW